MKYPTIYQGEKTIIPCSTDNVSHVFMSNKLIKVMIFYGTVFNDI